MPSNITCTSPFTNVGDDGGNGGGAVNYIEHQVSKMDTLAGVAIKYGVEVVDIKRMNGLASDLQMFALKTLHIPVLRRHPPSPTLSSRPASPREKITGRIRPSVRHSNAFESFQSRKMKSPQQKVSEAMITLQNFYGLKSRDPKNLAQGTEMTVCSKYKLDHYGDGLRYKLSPLNHLHKSRHLANGSVSENDAPIAEVKDGEGERSNEKYSRRRQNSEAESSSGTPEKLSKEENSGGSSSSFSPMTGKVLALRPKSVSRYSLVADAESGWLSSTADGLAIVHKSLSTPSLQYQDCNNCSFVWLTSKWSLKPDFQAVSAASIARPIFDGVPMPITCRKNKAALD